jgi:hypothetical protein
MRRFSRGDRVVLRAGVRRGRRHKYGRARVRRGTSGQVLRRHSKLGKPPRYDVDFRRRSRSVTVRKVPASSLRRPRSPLAAVLVVLLVALVIGYLSRHG